MTRNQGKKSQKCFTDLPREVRERIFAYAADNIHREPEIHFFAIRELQDSDGDDMLVDYAQHASSAPLHPVRTALCPPRFKTRRGFVAAWDSPCNPSGYTLADSALWNTCVESRRTLGYATMARMPGGLPGPQPQMPAGITNPERGIWMRDQIETLAQKVHELEAQNLELRLRKESVTSWPPDGWVRNRNLLINSPFTGASRLEEMLRIERERLDAKNRELASKDEEFRIKDEETHRCLAYLEAEIEKLSQMFVAPRIPPAPGSTRVPSPPENHPQGTEAMTAATAAEGTTEETAYNSLQSPRHATTFRPMGPGGVWGDVFLTVRPQQDLIVLQMSNLMSLKNGALSSVLAMRIWGAHYPRNVGIEYERYWGSSLRLGREKGCGIDDVILGPLAPDRLLREIE